MPTPMKPSPQRRNAFGKKPRGNVTGTFSDITSVLYAPSGSFSSDSIYGDASITETSSDITYVSTVPMIPRRSIIFEPSECYTDIDTDKDPIDSKQRSSSDSICGDASITETSSDMPYVSTVPMTPRRSSIFEPSECYTDMDTEKDPIDSKQRFFNCRCAFRFADMGTVLDSSSSPYNPHGVCCNFAYNDCERSNAKVHNPNDARVKIFEERGRRPLKSPMYWNKKQKVTLADEVGTGKGQGQMQELDVGSIGGKKTEKKGFLKVMAGLGHGAQFGVVLKPIFKENWEYVTGDYLR
ncbi:hypothetical protein QBC45DRAFT_471775 [Copromyces sp. CBS 386.78]|nr:hypothetical protein QBC45DRAFT_471775 [Copromyces sp. CBS 386.78]